MFTRIAEKLGILDIIAPIIAPRDQHDQSASSSGTNNAASNTARRSQGRKRRKKSPQDAKDEAFARKLQAEEDLRFQMLKSQKEEEDRAQQNGKYAKKQRVSYHHRGSDEYYDAVIVGVHLDDGPDKPYYTIKYTKIDMYMDDNGKEVKNDLVMEKQTTSDRLTALPWDEDKSWDIIGVAKRT